MELLILPFDHRASLLKKLFGIQNREPTSEERQKYAKLKQLIYEGFKLALKKGVKKEKAAILVDEEYGLEILLDAKKNGIKTIYTLEKSGQPEFDFEYADWKERIEKISPTYTKVLVRYNPEENNSVQNKKLKEANDYLNSKKRKLLFELLVPATESQLQKAGNQKNYDLSVRPKLMVEAIAQLQNAGIHPDVWKLEGVNAVEDAKALEKQANKETCEGIVILGRGESKENALLWVEIAAKIPSVIGFAVGRTIFWDPIKDFHEGKISYEEAVEQVCNSYLEFVELWEKNRHG